MKRKELTEAIDRNLNDAVYKQILFGVLESFVDAVFDTLN